VTTATTGGEIGLPHVVGPERALIVSSDGHAVARMADYRPYMPSGYHEEFDAFCEVHAREGRRISSAEHLAYPHHEGTWGAGPGTADYIRATLGAAAVPVDEPG
jgi:hypothetical protein